MRTTLDLDPPVLEELRKLQKRQGGTLGSLASRLLVEALARSARRTSKPIFKWTVRRMRATVDLADKEAVHALLDRPDDELEP